MADVAKGNETVEWACSIPQLIAGNHLKVSKGVYGNKEKFDMTISLVLSLH